MLATIENTINNSSKNWHALYVSSRTEKKVMQTLLSKNIEAYVPLVKTMRQWSDRKKNGRVSANQWLCICKYFSIRN